MNEINVAYAYRDFEGRKYLNLYIVQNGRYYLIKPVNINDYKTYSLFVRIGLIKHLDNYIKKED